MIQKNCTENCNFVACRDKLCEFSFCFVSISDRPEKPKILSCIAVQESKIISSNIKCQWEAVGHQTEAVPTNYTLFIRQIG